MRSTKKKQAGVGATASCFVKFIHPSKPVRDLYHHNYQKEKLGDFIITGEAIRIVRRRGPPAPVFLLRHDNWPNEELYVNKRNVTIVAEGSTEHFFSAVIVVLSSSRRRVPKKDEPKQHKFNSDLMVQRLKKMFKTWLPAVT
jgi:hypothetical protein